MQAQSDNELRQLARKRVDFRRHLIVYLIINGMLWLLWLVTGRGYPWPVWPMEAGESASSFIISSSIVLPNFFPKKMNIED
jgi:hypothetical protein